MEWTIEKFLWGWNVGYIITITDKIEVELACGDSRETFVVGDGLNPTFVIEALEHVLQKMGATKRG